MTLGQIFVVGYIVLFIRCYDFFSPFSYCFVGFFLFITKKRNYLVTNPPSQIPSEMLSDSKCNEFASFFSEKISNIRKEIGTSSCNTEVTQIRPQSQKEVTMSVFETIDSKTFPNSLKTAVVKPF